MLKGAHFLAVGSWGVFEVRYLHKSDISRPYIHDLAFFGEFKSVSFSTLQPQENTFLAPEKIELVKYNYISHLRSTAWK